MELGIEMGVVLGTAAEDGGFGSICTCTGLSTLVSSRVELGMSPVCQQPTPWAGAHCPAL